MITWLKWINPNLVCTDGIKIEFTDETAELRSFTKGLQSEENKRSFATIKLKYTPNQAEILTLARLPRSENHSFIPQLTILKKTEKKSFFNILKRSKTMIHSGNAEDFDFAELNNEAGHTTNQKRKIYG